jgi:NAD(P)-dependent dehydrogenase (short-subunit alcohol dehydrogenase family)
MVTQGQGCILFTASACTAIGGLATPAYAVTKHGIVGLAKNLAAELGQYGIRVNCVSPYGVATPMYEGFSADTAPMIEESLEQMGNLKGKIPKVEDMAMAALYLASDEANYVSGMNLVVDGGFSVVNPTMMKALYPAKL